MPHKYGKKYRETTQSIDVEKLYTPNKTMMLAKQSSTAKFDATVEAHVHLGVDPRHADQMVRSSVLLPHNTGKMRRIAVFATGEKAREAIEAGADVVDGENLVKKMQGDEIDFDVALATPDVMNLVDRLDKILGPHGMMPNPKSGTVTFDIAKAIKDTQGGRVEFRVDRFGIVHVPIGKMSFDDGALRDNFAALIKAIVRAKPAAAKNTYVKTVTVTPTMDPNVKVDPSQTAHLTTA